MFGEGTDACPQQPALADLSAAGWMKQYQCFHQLKCNIPKETLSRFRKISKDKFREHFLTKIDSGYYASQHFRKNNTPQKGNRNPFRLIGSF